MIRNILFLFCLIPVCFAGFVLRAQEILDLLDEVMLCNVDLKKAQPAEVTALLQKTTSSWKKKRIHLVFSVTPNKSFPAVTLKRDSISISEFLDFLDSSYGIRFRYFKHVNRILFVHHPNQLLDRVIPLDQEKGKQWSAGSLRIFLSKNRVSFPQGASVTVNRKKGIISLRNTWMNLEKSEKILGTTLYFREEDFPKKVSDKKASDNKEDDRTKKAVEYTEEKESSAGESRKDVSTKTLLQDVLKQKKSRFSRRKKTEKY